MKNQQSQKTVNHRDFYTQHWQDRFGSAPPKGIRTQTLALAYAYEQQAAIQGPLPPKTLRQLLSATKKKATPVHKTPGVRLVREWHGKEYTVDVLKEGYLYKNKRYKSLSEIAGLITGTHWSGPRFFRVKPQ